MAAKKTQTLLTKNPSKKLTQSKTQNKTKKTLTNLQFSNESGPSTNGGPSNKGNKCPTKTKKAYMYDFGSATTKVEHMYDFDSAKSKAYNYALWCNN